MNCCQCQGIEQLFSENYVAKELARYRAHGPNKTTRILINALKAENIQGSTLLDIGGGVGAIQHEMLSAGARSATAVEASAAYLTAAREETEHRGYAERVSYQHGNFVDLAEQIPSADIVTLDRVICCYHDMEKLVGLSVALARKLYALVYPRDVWWMKIGLAIQNLFFQLQRSPFRTYLHPTESVEALVNSGGFKRRFYQQTLVWQVEIYAR